MELLKDIDYKAFEDLEPLRLYGYPSFKHIIDTRLMTSANRRFVVLKDIVLRICVTYTITRDVSSFRF